MARTPIAAAVLAGGLLICSAEPDSITGMIVSVTPENRQNYGVETGPVAKADHRPEMAAWGEVLDPQPMIAQWSALSVAGIEAEAARSEAGRLERLNREGRLASDQAVEEARRRSSVAEAQVEQARQALVAVWGEEGFQALQADGLAGKVGNAEVALVRLSLPAGSELPAGVTGAVVSALNGTARLSAQALWPDPRVNATRQPGFLLIVNLGGAAWPVGTPLKGSLILPGDPLHGYLIPASAVIFEAGEAWVFQQRDAGHFEQRRIPLDRAEPDGWFVEAAVLDPGLPLVVHGAQGILGQKLQAVAGPAEGD